MRSPHLRGRDSYNRLPTTNNTFQNREVVVDEAWSSGPEWSQQKNSSVNTAASSRGEGDSFAVSSQKHVELAGFYIKTAQNNGEAIYTFENRMRRKYMVAAINLNETNASPDVRDVANVVELYLEHYHILCLSLDSFSVFVPFLLSYTSTFQRCSYQTPFLLLRCTGPWLGWVYSITISSGFRWISTNIRIQ